METIHCNSVVFHVRVSRSSRISTSAPRFVPVVLHSVGKGSIGAMDSNTYILVMN